MSSVSCGKSHPRFSPAPPPPPLPPAVLTRFSPTAWKMSSHSARARLAPTRVARAEFITAGERSILLPLPPFPLFQPFNSVRRVYSSPREVMIGQARFDSQFRRNVASFRFFSLLFCLSIASTATWRWQVMKGSYIEISECHWTKCVMILPLSLTCVCLTL